MTASVVALDVTVNLTTATPSITLASAVTSGDVLVLVEAGAFGSSSEHCTSFSGLGGTWTKRSSLTATPFDIWIGVGCSGTGAITGAGGTLLSSVNRKRLFVWTLTGVTTTIADEDVTFANPTAVTDTVAAELGQIVLAFGWTSSPPANTISAYNPTSGWTEPANDASGAYNLTTDNVRYGKPISRVPAGASENHDVTGIRASGNASVAILVIGDPGPGIPTSVSSPAQTGTTLDLQWSAPSGGGSVTGYEVRLDGGTPVSATSVHQFTGLTPGTSYNMEVRAVGPGGTSAWVSVVQSTLAAPNVPTSVTADPDATSIELTWSAPSGGGTVTSYDVRLDGGSASTATSPHDFTGLTPDTAYTVSVRAVGPGGTSAWVDVATETLEAGPSSDYWAKIRIGTHVWEIDAGDPATTDAPEILAGATFVWTASDNVGWPPPMWTVPRDVVQLKVRSPEASDVADVRKGDIVRFKFVPFGYDYDAPLVDFAGIITADPTITDDPAGGVFLNVTASDYRVLLTNFNVPGETEIAENGVTTIDDALETLSNAIDVLADGQFPGAFGDVTVGAVDPRGILPGTIGHDVIVPMDGDATAMTLFASIGMVPVPQYDDDGDLDPTQPFRIIEPDPYGETYDTPPTIHAALIPNNSVEWRRDYTPTVVEFPQTVSGYLWQGGVPGDLGTAVLLRLGSLAGFNQAGFSNEVPEEEPWSLYSFMVRAWENPGAVRDWFNYPDRVRQYVTINNVELIKNPAGDESVGGMLKGAALRINGKGRWTVQAGLRAHHFGTF